MGFVVMMPAMVVSGMLKTCGIGPLRATWSDVLLTFLADKL